MSILSHLFRILKTKTIKKKLSLSGTQVMSSCLCTCQQFHSPGEAGMHNQNALSQGKVMLIQNQ